MERSSAAISDRIVLSATRSCSSEILRLVELAHAALGEEADDAEAGGDDFPLGESIDSWRELYTAGFEAQTRESSGLPI